MSERSRHVVCEENELQSGEGTVIKVNGLEIAVKNVNGKLYAFQNICPHMAVPLVNGFVSGTMLPCEPHQHVYGCEDEIIRCPLHGWEFSLETGKTLFDPDRVKLRKFEVVKEGSSIVLFTK